jgi:hypothetical protein
MIQRETLRQDSEGNAEAWLWGRVLLRVVVGDEWFEGGLNRREYIED